MALKRILEGLTLVLIGVILLLNTTGQLAWSVWWSVLSLWPLLLIAAGLDIVAKGLDTEWLRVLSSLLVIAGLIAGAFVLPAVGVSPGLMWGVDRQDGSFDEVLERPSRVTEGSATIQGGAGAYTVQAGSASDLVRVSGDSPFGRPRIESEIAARSAEVRVVGPESGTMWVPRAGGPANVEIALSPEVLWALSIDTGAVDFTADLSDLYISELQMRSGVSSASLRLGDLDSPDRTAEVSVRGGVSSFTLEIPREVPVRVEAEAGLSSIDIDRSIPRTGSGERVWESEEWGRAGGYDVRFEAGVSSVRVVRY